MTATDEFRFCPRCATPLMRGVYGERERSACPACGWVHWDNPTPVVAAVIEYEGKVFLARNAAWPKGRFALVTGFLERDESPRDAVIREVREETQLDALDARLIGVYEFALRNQVIIAYHVPAQGEVRLNLETAVDRLCLDEEPRRNRLFPVSECSPNG